MGRRGAVWADEKGSALHVEGEPEEEDETFRGDLDSGGGASQRGEGQLCLTCGDGELIEGTVNDEIDFVTIKIVNLPICIFRKIRGQTVVSFDKILVK